jgi:hypothetical protein
MSIKQNQKFQSMLADGPVTILLFDNEKIQLEVLTTEELPGSATYQAGSMRNILQYLKSEPATAFELEAAIETIEDELIPVIPSLPNQRALVTSEPAIHQIAGYSPVVEKSRLEIAEVERLFNRLADVAYGTPAKMLGVPENREFVAVLLYLRELMHHAGFSSINLLK